MCTPRLRIVFSDLDGTLLTEKSWLYGKVRTYTLSTLGAFLEGGETHLILATGRNIKRAKAISNWLEERLGGYKIPYLICFNGGVIYDNKSNEVVYTQTFDCTQLGKLIQFLRRNYLVTYLVITSNNELFTEDHFVSRMVGRKFARRYNAKVRFDTQESFSKGLTEIQKVIFVTFHRNSEELRSLIESKFSEFYVAIHGDWLLEIVDKKINKFFAIEKILEREEWDLSECLGIGNEKNDLLMIEGCGFGVAVDFNDTKNIVYDPSKVSLHVSNKDGNAVARAIRTFS
ncbi:haloacid dehalogenase-like hydrolase family protein [Candidatus Mycoplasma haematolamae str. Purdue]|uniref:Haloacid dehalogenase-like hydrolase family protein n=1 Tax=Mycoplasma haematolamae (strain Purdue) TaxID=1212765 RepID=I7CIJ9_MYCHA|nr:haloacid dehalogenase-like hydrolase family protein [Candidatus Mycoplasma haematolamae str. Purdue]